MNQVLSMRPSVLPRVSYYPDASRPMNPNYDQKMGRPDTPPDLGFNVTTDPSLLATYRKLYGDQGPFNRAVAMKDNPRPPLVPPTPRPPDPTMPEIPPAMMRQIMASLAQRGFGTANGKPRLASKMAKSQWNSRVDDLSQQAYNDRINAILQYRTTAQSPVAQIIAQQNAGDTGKLLDPNYIKGLYEV